MTPVHPDIEPLVRERPVVLVFLPNTNELQRFVLSGAFSELAVAHELQYVLPESDRDTMLRAGAPVITPENSTALSIPPERFAKWKELFQAGCIHYAGLSPSFAIRAKLPVDSDWRQHWRMPDDERRKLDAEFDAASAALLQGLAPLPSIVELLDRFNPVYCVVPTSLLDVFCNDVAWACEAEGVSCVLLQSGWDNMSSKGLLYARTPFLGCWGPQSLKHAVVIQRLNKKRITPIGAPHYEFLKPAPAADVQELRAELGVQEGERLILFGGSFRQFDETSVLERLEDAAARGCLGPVKIVYRPHPWRASRQYEDSFFNRAWTHVVFDPDMRERYLCEQQDPGYIKRNAPMFDMAYLSRLLSASDAVISPMSTLLLESLILDKPTMAIAFGDGKHRYNPSVTAQTTHFDDLRGSRVLIWCDSADALVDDCVRLLRTTPEERAAPRRRLLRGLVTREPGTYAERLAQFCRSSVEPMARKLRVRRAGVKRDSVSHSYGAQVIARDYCGIHEGSPVVPGYWMHGWLPAYHSVHPMLIAQHKKPGQDEGYDFAQQWREDKAQTPQWVGRIDQAEFLKSLGYCHVRAIGLPITYLPPAEIRRVPGSLLVMPPHSHRAHQSGDTVAEAYAGAIADIRGRFEHVWVGVSADDMAQHEWVESFRRRGLNLFTTIDQADPRTLVRLRRILSTFEYVTTNGFGSHIAFAAYCGAKVSVFGPFAEFPRDRMRRTHGVKMFPELLDQACGLCTEDALRAHYPFLFAEPDRAITRQEWAAEELGEQCRMEPDELADLFGWRALERR